MDRRARTLTLHRRGPWATRIFQTRAQGCLLLICFVDLLLIYELVGCLWLQTSCMAIGDVGSPDMRELVGCLQITQDCVPASSHTIQIAVACATALTGMHPVSNGDTCVINCKCDR